MNKILIAHNLLSIDATDAVVDNETTAGHAMLGTVLANMAYFGYAPSQEAVAKLQRLSTPALTAFWKDVEPAFKELTGDNRNMGEFVVYKNFPAEVLEMSVAEYWFNQILMYLGAPNQWFTEEPKERPALNEKLRLTVLAPAAPDSLERIFDALVASDARWSNDQAAYAEYLANTLPQVKLDLGTYGFKENGVRLIAALFGRPDFASAVRIPDATDVLRLAAALSDADVSLRTPVAFAKFPRDTRRKLLALLEHAKNLMADIAMRPALWKKFLRHLHPGDYAFTKVTAAYDALYKGAYQTTNSELEAKLKAKDSSVLELLKTRPGEFARRLHKVYTVFGAEALQAFSAVLPSLDNIQLLKLRGYVATINGRETLIYAPGGNWSKAKFVPNGKEKFLEADQTALLKDIGAELSTRLKKSFPEGVDVAADTVNIKLQTNDQELASYGRGTVFSIPDTAKFIRLASFWKTGQSESNIWYDNGVNFLDAEFQPVGTCCWHKEAFGDNAAIFSGDPTSASEAEGRACQMIDLYLDQLQAAGVRYAVWNVLCYSGQSFDEAEDVLATLQWGDEATAGALYEPARAQMVFPLKGSNRTKYVAYVDVAERKLVYMDANLYGDVSSAERNEKLVAERLPAFIEYLNALPSVADLFMHADDGELPVLYSDAERELLGGARAYVFQPANPANNFKQVDLTEVLRT